MPKLHCPFPSAVHPEAQQIHEQSVEWARSLGLIEGEKQGAHLLGSKIGWLTARAFPGAQRHTLQIASDWTTLFCLLDDRIERIANPRQVDDYLYWLLAIFRGDVPPKDDDPVSRAFDDLQQRMRLVASEDWLARFSDQLWQLMACFSIESRNRRAGDVPEISTYLLLRERTVGLYLQFELSELTDGIVLPTEVRIHPHIMEMTNKASNVVGWANDIFTYEKELAEKEVHNLVRVLMETHGISVQEALARTVRMHDQEVEAFIELERTLPFFGDAVQEQVKRYVDMLRMWIRGHLDWAYETGRYRPASGDPEPRKEEALAPST